MATELHVMAAQNQLQEVEDTSVVSLPRRRLSAAPQEDWGALMIAGQNGHAGAYRRLLGELRQWLSRFYARRLPPGMVEDAVQEALIAIHEKRHTYDPSRPFRPWLAAIARYKWIDRLRATRRQFEELSDDLGVDDHESTTVSSIALTRLLSDLSAGQQEVIRLVKLDGLSIEEASERTGQSVSLVKVNIHRGLAKLSKLVQDTAHAD